MISRRFKALYTGRQAKNTTKLPLRVVLEASSKSTKKKAAKVKNEDGLQNLHNSKGIEVDPDKLRICSLLEALRCFGASSDSVPRATS
jgi:hypothetical protein